MKIAVYHNLPSGGAKRALYEQVRRLSQRHEIDVYTLSCADHTFCDLRLFVDRHLVFDFEPGPHFPHPFGLLDHGVRTLDILRLHLAQQTVAEEINNGDYDVVLVQHDQFTKSPICLRYLRTPTVYYCHDVLRSVYDPPIKRPYLELKGLPYWVNRLNPLRKWYLATVTRTDRTALRSTTRILVNSYFSRETLYRLHGLFPSVCYLGIDTERFKLSHKEKEDFVLSVGAVRPAKGFDFIVRSLALIPARQRPPLLIVGNQVNCMEKLFLQDLAEKNQVQIEFRSLVSDAQLVEYYNRARLTLYAPVLEPFGLVPLESMACGTPVVGVAEGGIRETVRHGETGLLTDREPERFADAIFQLLVDDLLAGKLGERGPDYVRARWNWADSVAQLDHYLEVGAKDDRCKGKQRYC